MLVREPWFCEPAYEKLKGTREGRLNSQLYSEKCYTLSRGFIRHALGSPVGSLEAELLWYYLPSRGRAGKLVEIIGEGRRLIADSEAAANDEQGEEAEEGENGRMSVGAAILLKRTILALEKQLDKAAV